MNEGTTGAGPSEVETPTVPASPSLLTDVPHGTESGSTPQRALITHVLVIACVVVFASMALRQLSSAHPSSEQLLLRWGANFGPLTLAGQWWRLLTSVFIHLGLLHLAVNMWCLWDLGSFAERIYGRATFLMIYLMSGVAGAMCSILWRPFAVEAGASGAIFGLAGALIASFFFGHLPFPRTSAKAALLGVIAFTAYNLFAGLFSKATGNAAHLGGLVSGFLLGLLIARTSLRKTLAVGALSILLGCGLLAETKGYVVPAERGRTALAAGHSDQSILALSESLQKNPKFAEGYALLGQAYLQKQQLAAAEAAYRHVLQLEPNASDVRYQLGLAVVAQGRADEALAIFRELARSNPKNPEGQMGIGTAAELMGNYQLAMEAFRRATEIDPRNPQAYNNLGLAALQAHHNDEAVSAFSKGVQLQPNNPDSLMHLALAYKANGMEKEAEETYRRALQASQAKPK